MATEYLSTTGPEMADRYNREHCAWCGAEPDPRGCYCRYCDSCSEYWRDVKRRDYIDGRPSFKLCPDCEESEIA